MYGTATLKERENINQHEPVVAEEKLQAFTRELTEVSRKHGIGIAGEPDLFVFEPEDYAAVYHCDSESRLTLD